MFLNYLFVFFAFLVDAALNITFPVRFAFDGMYFVPCIGLCSMALSVRKMDHINAILMILLFGMGYDFFYANTPFFYTIIFLLIYGIVYVWGKIVNESIIESLVLCISTVFTKELMVYLFMIMGGYTNIGFHTFLTNRLFLTIVVNAVFVFILILLAYIKDDIQKQREVRIRKEERLPWLH